MSHSNRRPDSLDEANAIDALCDDFERAWHNGGRPRLEHFLQQASPALFAAALEELLGVELEIRDGRGETPTLDEYLARFPERRELIERGFHQRLHARQQELLDVFTPGDAVCAQPASPVAHLHQTQTPRAVGTSPPLRLHIANTGGVRETAVPTHAAIVIGRDSQSDVCIADDKHFSRRHCRLRFDGGRWLLTDLNSHNGTLVNGSQVGQCTLNHGDVISGGETRITCWAQGNESQDATVTLPGLLAERSGEPDAAASSPAPPTATLGAVAIGGYRILGEIARGSMGVVYKARQPATGLVVAVKLIAPREPIQARHVQRFLREASILARLQHRRIVQALEVGVDAGRLFLAMQYVPHRPFSAWVRRKQPADQIRYACGVMCQALDALQYAHDQGVVHCDVKPGNLLLARVNRKLSARVADFGLAKSFAAASLSGASDTPAEGNFSPFMAPEQFPRRHGGDRSSDIFAAGATLYHYLSGQGPYDLVPRTAAVQKLDRLTPRPLRSRAVELPEDLVAIVDRSIACDPQHRFESAADMRRALRPFLAKR